MLGKKKGKISKQTTMQCPYLTGHSLSNYSVWVGYMANGASQQMGNQYKAVGSSSALAVNSCSVEQVIQPVFESLPFH